MVDIGALMTGVMHTMRWISGFFGFLIKYSHSESKWLTNSMRGDDFLEF